MTEFNRRITEILKQDVVIDEDGALSPRMYSLARDAKEAWVIFHDEVETELCLDGELYDVRDVASKTADNAARLATLLQVFEHGTSGEVGLEAFEGASRIALWHLHEARRFYGGLALSEEQKNVVALNDWLIAYCHKNEVKSIPRTKIQPNVTPKLLRKGAALDAALGELDKAKRVQIVKVGQRKDIHINPALLEKGAQ